VSHDRWYYFLSIERDFIKTIDFVEIHPQNENTYSNEYAKLLLLIGSEVDVVAKMLCEQAAPGRLRRNIIDYKNALTKTFAGFYEVEIDAPRYELKIEPWESWAMPGAVSPSWWQAYNSVKHNRSTAFSLASQKNTLHALCGLLAMLLYLYRSEGNLQPYPELLNHGFPDYIVTNGGKALPGV
jgi:hypothetical protein